MSIRISEASFKALLIFLAIILIVFFALKFLKSSSTQCDQAHQELYERANDFCESFNEPRDFQEEKYYVDSVSFSSDPAHLQEAIRHQLKKVLQKNKVILEEINIDTSALFAVQEAAYKQEELFNKAYKVDYLVIPEIKKSTNQFNLELGLKDYHFSINRDCSIELDFKVYFNKKPIDLFLKRLEDRIYQAMNGFLAKVDKDPTTCSFDMCAISQQLKSDQQLRSQIENLCEENEKFLIERIDDIFLKNYFNSLVEYFEKHPEEKYEIPRKRYTGTTDVLGISLPESVYHD